MKRGVQVSLPLRQCQVGLQEPAGEHDDADDGTDDNLWPDPRTDPRTDARTDARSDARAQPLPMGEGLGSDAMGP